MNPALRRSGLVALILLGVLIAQVTWVQFFSHADYDEANNRTLFEEYEVPRGLILAGDTVIAQSLESPEGSAYDYYRDYPEGDYFGNITGFKSMFRGASAIEEVENDVLNGSSSLFMLEELGSTFTGKERLGGNVVLTIDPELQRAAYEAIADAGVTGGAVVIEPRTGRILAQASYPGWNPTEVASNNSETANAAWTELLEKEGNPGEDKTRSNFFPPGSTFKTIVASAYLENGGSADDMVPAGNGYTAPDTDHEITNSSDQCPQQELTLREAFKRSCNTTFARLCVEHLSADDITEMAEAYGFGEAWETPLPTEPSRTGDLSAEAFRAQACIGQQEARETVLQNALIAATIANDGEIMAPQLVSEITDSEGTTLERRGEDSAGRAISAETASQLRDLMEAVTEDGGTGSAARFSGATVGGKTGTAEHSDSDENLLPDHGWFHGWATADDGDRSVAVCVFLDSYGSGASSKAAEISGDLMEQALSEE